MVNLNPDYIVYKADAGVKQPIQPPPKKDALTLQAEKIDGKIADMNWQIQFQEDATNRALSEEEQFTKQLKALDQKFAEKSITQLMDENPKYREIRQSIDKQIDILNQKYHELQELKGHLFLLHYKASLRH